MPGAISPEADRAQARLDSLMDNTMTKLRAIKCFSSRVPPGAKQRSVGGEPRCVSAATSRRAMGPVKDRAVNLCDRAERL